MSSNRLLNIININLKPMKNNQNVCNLRIEASQWEYKAYDLNLATSLMGELDITDLNTGFEVGKFRSIQQKHFVGSFEQNALITIELYRRDVQHYFAIDEVNIKKIVLRANPGKVFGPPTIFSFNLPDKDTTLKSYSHSFVGLGTDNMILRFIVGDVFLSFSFLQIEIALWLYFAYFWLMIVLFISRTSFINEWNGILVELYPVNNEL